jgi:hypothetical protein
MKEARPLSVLDTVSRITVSVDDPYRILICLSTIRHETHELRVWDVVSLHHRVQILLEDNLSILILRLHVAACNGHHPTIR